MTSREALRDRVEAELAAIPDLDRSRLLECWQKDYGKPAPKGISRRLLEYSAAYNIQVRAYGGLSAATKRKLARYAEKSGKDVEVKEITTRSRKLARGTRLVREWHGRSHHIEVTDEGYFYNDKIWKSLSQIAREITGARWSGPRFFGL